MSNYKTAGLASLLTLLTLTSQPSFAEHFHYFMDTETTFRMDQNQQIKSVDISWVYDEKMSALMKAQNPNLQALGKKTLDDLSKNHYFTNIQFNKKPIKTEPVKQFQLQEISDKGKKLLQLDFTLPFAQPVTMQGKNKFTWNFADPSGVAIIVYSKISGVRLDEQLRSHCKAKMWNNEDAQHGDPEQFLKLKCSM